MNIIRVKVGLIGDSSCGKTSIINQLVKKTFNSAYQTTLGIEHQTYEIKIKKDHEYTVQFHILDLTGFSVFRDLIESHIKECNVIMYVYNITDVKSFESVKLWKESIANLINHECLEYIVGNKIDLERKIAVDDNSINNACKQLNCDSFKVSALQAKGIDEMFTKIGNKYYYEYVNYLNNLKKLN